MVTRNQKKKRVDILSLLKEILKPKETDEQQDTTDMPELGSEESAE